MDSAAWSATFAGVSALAAIGTGGIAGWALWGQREDSRDRSRPIVTASLRPGPEFTHGYLYLEICNRGRSVARSVSVTFDPELTAEQPAGEPSLDAPFIAQRYATPITLMAPGQSFANIYWDAFSAERGEVLTPEEVRVTIKYTDDRRRSYEDTFDLAVESHKHETRANPGDSNDVGKRTAKAIEAATWEIWRN